MELQQLRLVCYLKSYSILLNDFKNSHRNCNFLGAVGKPYEVPCYRWLSHNRDDAAVFRMLWVYPNEELV